jgi:phosphoserine phosphatase RsbU/P
MFEFSAVVNGSVDLRFILGHFLLTLMGKLLSRRGIVLLQRSPGLFIVETAKGCPAEITGRELPVRLAPKSISPVPQNDDPKKPWLAFFREQGVTLLVPLISQEKIVGIAGFAPMKPLSADKKEITYLRSLANIAAGAIAKGMIITELNQVNRQLDSKIQELNTLFELGKEFTIIIDPDKLVKLLMFAIMGQIGAVRYLLCLDRGKGMEMVSARIERQIGHEQCALFTGIEEPVLTGRFSRKGDASLHETLAACGLKILVPLRTQSQTRGIIALGDKMGGQPYNQADISFLTALANLAMVSLENARLFKEELEKQKLEDELSIARDIQKGLLPKELPQVPGFDIAAANISSKQVGGDYYDVIAIGNGKFVIAIGDVSGKGTPASLLMANLQATIRALVPLDLHLPELTKRVNDLVCDSTSSDRFITFFWGVLNTTTRRLKYVSAGHNPPFLFRADGKIERLEKGGLILGIMKAMIPYEEGEVTINPGDALIMFTDGVSEAMDVNGEEFEEERLEAVIRATSGQSSAVIQGAIIDAVKKHSTGAPQSDDITTVVLRGI